MPRHTATGFVINYHERRKHNAPDLDLDNLPDGGDIIDLLQEAWDQIQPLDLYRSRAFSRTATVRRGRVLLLKGRVGHFGSPARVRDVNNDKVLLEHDGELVNEPEVRLVLAVPGTRPVLRAYLIAEWIEEGGLRKPYCEALRTLWADRYPGHTLDIKAVTEGEAWLKAAQLRKITVQYKDQPADLADGDTTQELGVVTSVIQRPKGFLRRRNLEMIKADRLLAGRLVGHEVTDKEPDHVSVTMVHDGREKTFSIDHERTPVARWLLSDYGQPVLSDEDFLRRCLEEVNDLMVRVGGQWHTGWEHPAATTRPVTPEGAEPEEEP